MDAGYQIINNAVIGGGTGAQMLGRIQTDVLDFMPAEVWLNHGTNDVYVANLTVQQIIDTDKVIYDRPHGRHHRPRDVDPATRRCHGRQFREVAGRESLAQG